MKSHREGSSIGAGLGRIVADRQPVILGEAGFQRMVLLERKRAERSAKPCLLMLLDPGDAPFSQHRQHVLARMVEALPAFTRETDVTGWQQHDHTLGVIFIDISREGLDHILKTMLSRLKKALRATLGQDQANRIQIFFELFPERRDVQETSFDKRMPPDFVRHSADQRREVQTIS